MVVYKDNLIDNIPCVILSGGKSSRMGEDKSLLSFRNFKTLIEYQKSKLSKIFKNIYISSKNENLNWLSSVILDESKDISSPMIALDSILSYLKSSKVFIIPIDVPLISKKSILNMVNMSQDYDITISKTNDNKIHNLCGIFNKSLQPQIQSLIKNNIHKISTLINQSNTNILKCENQKDFFNMNTKEDYYAIT